MTCCHLFRVRAIWGHLHVMCTLTCCAGRETGHRSAPAGGPSHAAVPSADAHHELRAERNQWERDTVTHLRECWLLSPVLGSQTPEQPWYHTADRMNAYPKHLGWSLSRCKVMWLYWFTPACNPAQWLQWSRADLHQMEIWPREFQEESPALSCGTS